MKRHEEFAEPVGGPILTRPFMWLCAVFGLGFLLTIWREIVGLGPATGMNDGFAWGLWKNWNVIALTALGSGGYATALLFYVLGNRKFLPLARVALVTSMLAYTTGIIALTVDLGRPWNFWRLGFPQDWNLRSVLLEVAVCMTTYVGFLFLENAHPALEAMLKSSDQGKRKLASWALPVLDKGTPWFVAAGIVLPSMHQSSLGSLFLLAGPRLHDLWRTDLIPLLFIVSAHFLGYACVVLVVMLSGLVWNRPLEMQALNPLARIMSWVIFAWLAVRAIQLVVSGKIAALGADWSSLFFLLEMALLAWGAFIAFTEEGRRSPQKLFTSSLLIAFGGLLYRYDLTTLAFNPGPMWRYFPTVTETLIALGYMALAVIGYIVMVKRLPILPTADAHVPATHKTTAARPAVATGVNK